MRHFLSGLPYPDRDPAVVGSPDPMIVGPAEQVLDLGEPAEPGR